MLDHGADVAAAGLGGKTALLIATEYGHGAVTKLLLDHGADLDAADFNGNTALIYAAKGGHEAVTKLLLDYGADVAAADIQGATALLFATKYGHEGSDQAVVRPWCRCGTARRRKAIALKMVPILEARSF